MIVVLRTLNVDKCKLLVLPERKAEQVELGIDGSQVKANDNVELLGVLIDNKLNFKSHISLVNQGSRPTN